MIPKTGVAKNMRKRARLAVLAVWRRPLSTPSLDTLAERGNIDHNIYVIHKNKVPDLRVHKMSGFYLY